MYETHRSQTGISTGDQSTYLSNGLQAAGELNLVDAMVYRLAIGGTLGHGALAATTAHADTVHNVACKREAENAYIDQALASNMRTICNSCTPGFKTDIFCQIAHLK